MTIRQVGDMREGKGSTIGMPDSAANLRLDSTMGAQMGASCPASCLCEDVRVSRCARRRLRGVLLTRQIAFFFFARIFLAEIEIRSS